MKRFYYFLLLAIVFDLGAGDQNEKPSLIPKGTSSFVYQNENLNKGWPITVYSYLPTKYEDSSQILIVMHGNGRTAENYRDAWIDSAEQNNALLLVPHFSRENGFPEDDQYNMGNMFKMDPDENLLSPNPESEWSYSLIDPIFDFVVERMKNHSTGYLIYGHSAGSQFLHRLLFFKPGAKIKKAVCANAGWYTMPDFDQIFPYGLKETQCSEESLRKLFAKKVTILLGNMDTDPDHSSLRRTPQAMQQGAHRFQRGHTFYRACKQIAEKLGVQFRWDLEVVSGVAHSNRQMAPSAAKVLFEASDEADYDPSLFSALRWRNIGPIAAPGKYQVRVTADGETQAQPFRVVRDPRPKDLTDSDIEEQFSLALKVRDRISEANEAVLLIRDVKRQVRDRIEEAENDPITSLGESLNKTLSGIEGKVYQVHLRSQLDAIKHPIMLNNRLANLQLSIETGDGRPTKQAYAAFQELSSELDVLLGKLNNALKTELIQLNQLLAGCDLEPVIF
jgi:hypothetical protein